ncbi:MAG: ABC transporter permease [Actinomycetia bacterium]|nr:ABC transporter permease [Actinomycetes bacterium]
MTTQSLALTLPHARASRRTAGRPSLRATLTQTLMMAWRALKKMSRNLEQSFDVLIQPLLFVPMFASIFGGAISSDGKMSGYLPLLIPGLLAQTALTACMATGVQLREDMDKGVFDRFRSLPIARIAPLAGPALADVARYAVASVLTLAMGVAVGYRPAGGWGIPVGLALIIMAGWSLGWIFTWLGSVARSAQAVQGISMMIMFPLTFMSNAFVPASTLPGWLRAFVSVNPVSHIVTACRALMNGGALTADLGWAAAGCAVVVAVFAPMAVRAYSRKM